MTNRSVTEVPSLSTTTSKVTRPSRLNRIAWTVDDIVATKAALKDLLGMSMRDFPLGDFPLKVGIEENGLEPLQPMVPNLAFTRDARLPIVEVAISVHDAEATKARFEKAKIVPFHKNHMKVPDSDEYNYGASVFHGIPLMVGTIGDSEQENSLAIPHGPFRDLESAPPPKMGLVSLEVESVEKVASDFERFFDMKFVPDNACGLGKRAVVGSHRIRLVEDPIAELRGKYPPPVVSSEMAVEDVEASRVVFEKAGILPIFERKLKSGRKVYYFGYSNPIGLPVAIYAIADDAEIRGLAST